MPPHLGRFPSGPNLPYHQQQFQSHGPQAHPNHNPLGGGHSYMNANSQLAFQTGNGGQMGGSSGGGGGGGGGGMNGAGSFMDAGRLAFQGAGFQQPHAPSPHGGMSEYSQPARPHPNKSKIRDVYRNTLEQEFDTIRKLVDHFPYVAMSLEFPGIIARPMGGFQGKADYHYQCMRVNVDMLSVIQLGLTLHNSAGETPGRSPEHMRLYEKLFGKDQAALVPSTWQFNFKFNPDDDMCNEGLIAGMRSTGVDFEKAEREGIDPATFASLLTTSGLVLENRVPWISFHGGYDFGYLVTLLRGSDMPAEEKEYRHWMSIFFPETYDVKYIIKQAIRTMAGMNVDPAVSEILSKLDNKNTLEAVADALKLKKLSASQQAGSNSIITGKLFFFLRDKIFNGAMKAEYVNQVFGLGNPEHIAPNSTLMGAGANPAANANANAGPSTNGGSEETGSGDGNMNGNNNNNPSTPNNVPIGLASTPTPHNVGGAGQGLMTPGGGGGVFGNFAFNQGGLMR